MSAVEEDTIELKAGHAPAIRVGNRRVPRPRNSSGSEKVSSEELARQAAEYGTEIVDKPGFMSVSGAIVKEDKAFPAEAVKAYHDKPKPAQEKPHVAQHHNIHQPRKQ